VIHPRHAAHRALAHAGHARHGAFAAGEIGEDRFGRTEGEIDEEDHHLLLVAALVGGIADDERRREQLRALEADMRMHPVGAGAGEREVVIVALSRRQRRLRQARHTVLRRRRLQPVPMDERRLVETVVERHQERLAFGEMRHRLARGKAEHRRRFTFDLEHAFFRGEAPRCGGTRDERAREQRARAGADEQGAAGERWKQAVHG
jgi:hypothetical protein